MLACLSLTVGCNKPDPATSTSPSPLDSSPPVEGRTKVFSFDGVVRAIDPDEGIVSIDHENIPDLMPAMLMDFRLSDRPLLEDVIVDDEVRGTLEVDYDDRNQITRLELVDLVVTRPAPPRPATADLIPPPPSVPVLEPGQEVPDFAMTTQDGDVLRLSDLRGQVVVLTFIFTRCPQPEFCPLMDRKFSELERRLARSADRASRVRLLSVSFDPEHDTPEVLAEHARRVGARPPLWTFAVASHDELRLVAQPLGLSYAPMTDQILHSLSTSIISPEGRLIRLETGNNWEPEGLYGEIRRLLDAESR